MNDKIMKTFRDKFSILQAKQRCPCSCYAFRSGHFSFILRKQTFEQYYGFFDVIIQFKTIKGPKFKSLNSLR